MKKFIIAFAFLVSIVQLHGQSTFISYNRDYYHLIDRFDILYSGKELRLKTTYKPIRRVELANFLKGMESQYEMLSPQDKFNYEYLMNDNWETAGNKYNSNDKSWWDIFYNRKSDFLYYEAENFTLRLNPVIDFSAGKETDNDEFLYTNTRGLEVQGTIDDKIAFYTFLTTTQLRVPSYVGWYNTRYKAFPNEGFYKIDDHDKTLFDLTHARGYFTFNLTNSIDIQAGYDKQFIGSGIRSMVLSDISSPMLFGKINTRLGPFLYTNLWAELTEDIIFSVGGSPADGSYPKKFMAMHRLGVDITPKFNLGVYEVIIADDADINYFNPIIFYRAIEQQQGSPDNILLGMDFQWNLLNKFQLYGQFMLDEFLIDALRSGDGDWRNKFGVQLGGKYINAFNINNLDFGAEANFARPYFYAYDRPELSYTNYRNPLAHPLGANLKEFILTARYQPINRLTVSGKVIRSQFGEDENGLNYGGNPLLSTDDRVGATGNTIGQGVATTNTYLELTGSYMLLQNLFVDWKNIYRNFDSEDATRSSSPFISMLSLRWNIAQRQHEF
ncbi:hypothetical protein [Roseivirga pacifica]|uniref:hypothetical protein n=1 Tax=Roseivirga pacifica TaxID=1267423 RepID=UPI003BACFD07